MNSLDHKISVIKYHYHAFYVIRWLLDQTSVRELPIYKTPHLSLYWIYYSSMQQFNGKSQETVLLLLFVSPGIILHWRISNRWYSGISINSKEPRSFLFLLIFLSFKVILQLHLENKILCMHEVWVFVWFLGLRSRSFWSKKVRFGHWYL